MPVFLLEIFVDEEKLKRIKERIERSRGVYQRRVIMMDYSDVEELLSNIEELKKELNKKEAL
jgi:uncharacterized membrane protein (DUF106 family)